MFAPRAATNDYGTRSSSLASGCSGGRGSQGDSASTRRTAQGDAKGVNEARSASASSKGLPLSETILVRAILDALTAKGYWSWRENSGLTVFGAAGTHSRRVVRGAPPGTPDIFVVLPGGKLAGIECKTATGRQNPNQKAWQKKAEAHGVRYGIARTVSEGLALVTSWSSTT
jgi:hypothetical protein